MRGHATSAQCIIISGLSEHCREIKAGMGIRAKIRLLAVCCTITLGATTAHADPKAFIDGYELLRLCESAAESGFSRATDCLGYVSGLSDAHEAFSDLKILDKQWCWPPDGISNRQMAAVVFDYLKNNTALLDKSAALLGSFAFLDAYPCR